MVPRLPSEQRREQLVRAVLALLGDLSVDQLSTRRVAEAVGISQPALFRHFDSKDALLQAVMEYLASSVEALAREELEHFRAGHSDLRACLTGLLGRLFAFAEQHPGAPRLLFFDAAATASGEAPASAPLRRLVGTQTLLIGQLLEVAVERGQLAAGLDSGRAARLFVALFQGELLRWHFDGHPSGLVGRVASLVGLYFDGLASDELVRAEASCPGPAPSGSSPDATTDVPPAPDTVEASGASAQPTATAALLQLDTRALLDAGTDPFEEIQRLLARLTTDGYLFLTVPFRPDPLLALLEQRGLRTACEVGDSGLFSVAIGGPESVELLDLRDLPAPEPLVAVLERSSALEPGAQLFARLPQAPRLLLPRLAERGLDFELIELPGDGAVLRVQQPAD